MLDDFFGCHLDGWVGEDLVDFLLNFGVFLNFERMTDFLHESLKCGDFLFPWEWMLTQESLCPNILYQNLAHFLVCQKHIFFDQKVRLASVLDIVRYWEVTLVKSE